MYMIPTHTICPSCQTVRPKIIKLGLSCLFRHVEHLFEHVEHLFGIGFTLILAILIISLV